MTGSITKFILAVCVGAATILSYVPNANAQEEVKQEIETLKADLAEQQRYFQELINSMQEQMDEQAALYQKKIDGLQRQLDANVVRTATVAEVDEVEGVSADAQSPSPDKPVVSFGGQYRINAYTAGNGTNDVTGGDDNQTAARLRIRQNIDIRFNQRFKTHLQLELQHVTDNVTRTASRFGGKETNISVRHAVMDYSFDSGVRFEAGLVPLSDNFHDTLFSSDWDYNPLAAAIHIPLGEGTLRAFAATLKEGAEDINTDDFIHYQLDYSVPLGSRGSLNFGGSLLELQDFAGTDDSVHFNAGVGGSYRFDDDLSVNGFVMWSKTNRNLLGGANHASGIAALVELTRPLGSGNLGLLASWAEGASDGSGFLTPMALAKTFGYWGYTGILTIQGPTDTGFDFDGVNFSNNGYGLTTVQGKYTFPINSNLSGYLSAGWFGNSRASGRDRTVGIDALAMGTYRFTDELALDFGFAYAHLNDSVSGYFQGVQGGAAFNQSAGFERDKWVFFARLQAEFN